MTAEVIYANRFVKSWILALVLAALTGQGRAAQVLGAPAAWPQAVGEAGTGKFANRLVSVGDVNGDGYADAAVGAPSLDAGLGASQGKVYLYLGSASGYGAAAVWPQGVGQAAGEGFGTGVAAIDANGDGYSDVVVGALGADAGLGAGQGRAYLFLGSASGLGASAVWPQAVGEATGGQYASVIAPAGDVNGDGYGDLAIAAPEHNAGLGSGQGKAYLYLGSATGFGAAMAWPEGVGENVSGSTGFFGSALGAADVNGDGYGDLVVGSRSLFVVGKGAGTGKAYLFLGSAAGLGAASAWPQAEGEAANSSFGGALTAGDFNGDGYGDMVVGAFEYNAGLGARQGKAYLFPGSSAGLGGAQVWSQGTGPAGDSFFAWALASGADLNGDGYADLVVGAFGRNAGLGVRQGQAYLYLGSAAGLGAATAWPQAVGEQADAQFGETVAMAGDADGDGFGDVMVGAPDQDAGLGNEQGKAYLFRGSPLALGAAASWPQGIGEAAGSNYGNSVASAGDVNGDGYHDLIVGANGHDAGLGSGQGRAYLYLGSAAGIGAAEAWPQAIGDQGAAYFGWSVASAGDVNGDGFGDVVVGANYDNAGLGDFQGQAYLYLGSAAGLGAAAAWPQGVGAAVETMFGYSVASAGDVNGDGYGDVIVGAPGRLGDVEGRVYLYLGSAAGLAAAAAWPEAVGEALGARFGDSVASAGDVNGDGYGDVIVGAPRYNAGLGANQGKAYLFLGSAAGLGSAASWPQAVGESAGAAFGNSVASAGDVNGDGYSDVVVGAYVQNAGLGANQGKAYLFLGSATGLGAAMAWPQAVGEAADNQYGHSVASAGDVNGDGYGDVAVGAWRHNAGLGAFQGKVYLYLGSAAGLAAAVAWPQGVGQMAPSWYGYSVASAGDLNGDGFGDLVVGAHQQDAGSGFGQGKAFVNFGNESAGLPRLSQALAPDLSRIVATGGAASFSVGNTGYNLRTLPRSPNGRTRAKLQVETKTMGTPFNGTGLQVTGVWTDTTPTAAMDQAVGGLLPQTAYRWRARWIYEPAKAAYGWLHSAWFEPQQAGLSGHPALRTGPQVNGSPTSTPSPTPSATATPTASPTSTASPSASPTMTPSATSSMTPSQTPSESPSPTASPTLTSMDTPSSTPSATTTPSPSHTPTASPSATPSATPAAATPTLTASPGPVRSPEPDKAVAYPSPVKGGAFWLEVVLDAPGSVKVEIFNERGDLAARHEALGLGAGRQAVAMDASGFAPGLYYHRCVIKPESGADKVLPVGKFLVLR